MRSAGTPGFTGVPGLCLIVFFVVVIRIFFMRRQDNTSFWRDFDFAHLFALKSLDLDFIVFDFDFFDHTALRFQRRSDCGFRGDQRVTCIDLRKGRAGDQKSGKKGCFCVSKHGFPFGQSCTALLRLT